LPGDFGVAKGSGHLVDDLAVPVDAKPGKPVDDRLCRFRGRTLAVGVLDAQPKHAAVMAREEPIEEGGAGPTDMQKTGRRRGETDGDGHPATLTLRRDIIREHFAQFGLHHLTGGGVRKLVDDNHIVRQHPFRELPGEQRD